MKKLFRAAAIVFLCHIGLANAQAPSTYQTLDQFGAASALSGTDQFPVYQGSNPLTRAPMTSLGTYMASLSQTLTGKTISGASNTLTNIANASLTNSTMTVNGTTCTLGASCAPAGASFANPTATAGPTAVNGTASTAMRSDAAVPVQKASNAQLGLVQGDNQSFTVDSSGVGHTSAPNRSTSVTPVVIGTGDMGGQINWTGSSAGTVSNVTITSTLLALGQSVTLCNQSSAALTLPTAPLINGYTPTTLPAVLGGVASCINLLSNGGSLDAMPTQVATPVTDPICATWDSTTAVTAQTIDFPIAWSTYTISSVKAKTAGGGSFTYALKIGGTAVTSCNVVTVNSSANVNTSCTAANTGVVNDIVSVVVASPSGTVNQAYVCPVFSHSVN